MKIRRTLGVLLLRKKQRSGWSVKIIGYKVLYSLTQR